MVAACCARLFSLTGSWVASPIAVLSKRRRRTRQPTLSSSCTLQCVAVAVATLRGQSPARMMSEGRAPPAAPVRREVWRWNMTGRCAESRMGQPRASHGYFPIHFVGHVVCAIDPVNP